MRVVPLDEETARLRVAPPDDTHYNEAEADLVAPFSTCEEKFRFYSFYLCFLILCLWLYGAWWADQLGLLFTGDAHPD